ncbi:16S rRNA (guanine(966)-N(2))-methyltransferase RsmD [Gandjariella thermophila]|uniref:Methyltransferase n=1 Tax=Gandjariella thermophila TaxID=1931992 RepID=A0A4D4JD41_9PSEU|nr:16S rRNA (guanine(966)-N(2))-methyltransferase RsmD [Gandjariella thermophila]GDY32578.1 methyltransferase [Gandjariella thermophila]
MTRIVAGTAGGRRLVVPPRGTRPTSERVREALFSALDATVGLSGTRVLDLFAGSGALGLEALSRGAAHALFVESDRRAAEVLRRNARSLGLPGVEVRHGTAAAVLAAPADAPYDIVLADPPYALAEDALAGVLAELPANGWTAPGSLVVVERAARSAEPRWPEGFAVRRSRRYGDSVVYWAAQEGDAIRTTG